MLWHQANYTRKQSIIYAHKRTLINFATDNIMLYIPPTVEETLFLMPVELTGGGGDEQDSGETASIINNNIVSIDN